MSLNLEWAVSQAVLRAHVLERALHDSGPWSIQLGDSESPAERQMEDTQIIVSAPFAGSWQGTFTATLYCGSDALLTKLVTLDEGGAFYLDWAIAIGTSDSVAA